MGEHYEPWATVVEPDPDDCAWCGAYNDPMGGNEDAISRLVQGKLLLWCGLGCLSNWVEQKKTEHVEASSTVGNTTLAAGPDQSAHYTHDTEREQ